MRSVLSIAVAPLFAGGCTAMIAGVVNHQVAWLLPVGAVGAVSGSALWLGLLVTRAQTPFPDMLIGDLFHHVRVSMGGQVEWTDVGRSIQDELALGLRLKAWGKQVAPTNSLARHLSAQTEMKPEVWTTGRFSYWFLDPPNKLLTDYWERTGEDDLQDWAEVYVNRRQALKIWRRLDLEF